MLSSRSQNKCKTQIPDGYSAIQILRRPFYCSQRLRVESPTVLERAGLIQFFEMAFDLSWKLLEDYEQLEGIVAKSPREVIKQAHLIGLIREGHQWIDALGDRNLVAHAYKEYSAQTVEQNIRKRYYFLIADLYETFKAKKAEVDTEDGPVRKDNS